ncbi:MAG: hypothetical protein ACP5J4_18375 [Anaerolineae bacterium]
MKTFGRSLVICLALLILLLGLGRVTGVIAQLGRETKATVVAATPTLQNAGFDNHRWYEFNDRYGTWLVGSWVPDDDDGQRLQDWRLWYMRNTPLVKSFPESGIVQAGVESVALRSYSGDVQEGGLYQVIYDVTPCLHYQFQIYGLSRPDDALPNPAAELRVGLDATGWHTDPASDPALPGYYPASIVWSAPQDFKYPNFGLLQVTAEAQSDKVTAYTRALAYGGTKHAIVWDSGTFQEATPAMLHDPTNLPTPTINNANAAAGQNSAQINWSTEALGTAVSQVYYALRPAGNGTPPDYPYKIYLPMVTGGTPPTWTASPIDKTPATEHSVTLYGLLSGRTYDYIAVSRGLNGGACTTWVSAPQQFTTTP